MCLMNRAKEPQTRTDKAPAANGGDDLDYAREVLRVEARAVSDLVDKVGEEFQAAVEAVLATKGQVVVTGMGKPGFIGQKISATLASTGTPSLYLHPAEALHGDLGRVRRDDLVLMLSNSGETDEIVRLISPLKKVGVKIIGMCGSRESTLAKNSDIVLWIGSIQEACPMGMAPSASTTAMLALGDALALTLVRRRGFGIEDFAQFHPGGSLGRKLLKVHEVMRRGNAVATIPEQGLISEALVAITRARAGSVLVTGADGKLTGIFTDGDLRRLLQKGETLDDRRVGEVMTRGPKTVAGEQLASEAVKVLKQHRIDELPVVDGAGRPIGLLDVQDLLAVGLV